MKRFVMLAGVAVVAGAMYVAAAPGSGQATAPTARQFAALKKHVANLSTTLKALKKDEGNVKTLAVAEAEVLVACAQTAVPVDQFGDGTNHTEGYRYTTSANIGTPASDTLDTALDAAVPTDPTAVFFIGGDSTCATALNTGAASLRNQAALAGVKLPRAVTHRPAFAAHR